MDQACNKLIEIFVSMYEQCKEQHIIINNMQQHRINKLEIKKNQLNSVVADLEKTNRISREQLALQKGKKY